MTRFRIGGTTSKLPPPDEAFWRSCEEECENILNKYDRLEIEIACHAYKMAVIARTQNGDAESVEAWLEEVKRLADSLSKVLDERAPKDRPDKKRGREQAIGIIDDTIDRYWPVHAGARGKTQGLLFVLTSACHHGKESLPHLPQPDQSARDTLLARLGAVYTRASGKPPRYSSPPDRGAPGGGEAVRPLRQVLRDYRETASAGGGREQRPCSRGQELVRQDATQAQNIPNLGPHVFRLGM